MVNDVMVIDGFQVPSYVKALAPVENDFGRAGGLPTIATHGVSSFKITLGEQEKLWPAFFSNEAGQIQPRPLPIVILGVTPKGMANNRSYYKDAYVEGQVSAPDCSSSDGVTPDDGDFRQSATCANCPMAVFGSAPGDRKGQACAQGKTLFVTPASATDGTVYQIRVAPTSLKAVASYGARLVAAGINPATAITNLGLVPDTESLKTYAILRLELGGFLDEVSGTKALERSKSPEILSLIVTPQAALPPTPTAPPIETTTQPEAQVADGFEPPKTEVVYRAPEEQPAPQQGALAGFRTDPETGEKLDITGTRWNADLHSSGKTMLQDGTWRKKAKGKKTAAAAGPTAAEREAEAHRQAAMTQSSGPAGGQDPLTDALGEWG